MPYTTEELLDILDRELRAAWRGERVVLSSAERLNNSVVAKALGAEKLSKVFAIQDFRDQIHHYQREHQVSGLVCHTCRFGGRSLQFPELHPQLTAIPTDKIRLIAAKSAVVEFWRNSINGLQFWHVGRPPAPTTPTHRAAVEQWIAEAEWAEIDATRTELYLSLCWGDPKECHYDWGRPASGCERIIAAIAEPSAIKV
ncbi:hypothetical protein [Leptolyngbya sp. PCC 6406]|uniref:hypothetical protein n=1 Tax=Leptolyngbya sp. PCC 6406 TaxID=1173264 RepID=UPI0002ABFE06|nr:hypothetical protein [Leptolyngbya sp. PCC 6406]